MVEDPCRALFSAALWNGYPPQTTIGVVRASTHHCHPGNCQAITIDKMSTGIGTSDNEARSYRYGYGIVDENFNWKKDPGEKKVYFEISDYSTSYVFYENYRD